MASSDGRKMKPDNKTMDTTDLYHKVRSTVVNQITLTHSHLQD